MSQPSEHVAYAFEASPHKDFGLPDEQQRIHCSLIITDRLVDVMADSFLEMFGGPAHATAESIIDFGADTFSYCTTAKLRLTMHLTRTAANNSWHIAMEHHGNRGRPMRRDVSFIGLSWWDAFRDENDKRIRHLLSRVIDRVQGKLDQQIESNCLRTLCSTNRMTEAQRYLIHEYGWRLTMEQQKALAQHQPQRLAEYEALVREAELSHITAPQTPPRNRL